MKIVNKLLCLMLIAVLILSVFAACGGGGTKATDPPQNTSAPTAKVTAPPSTQNPSTPDPNKTPSPSASYVGNKKSMKFHTLTCGFQPNVSLMVKFATREDAISAGYAPCDVCNP